MVAMERRTVRALRKTDVVLVRGSEDLPGRPSANAADPDAGQVSAAWKYVLGKADEPAR